MDGYGYAHNDTSETERKSATAVFNKPKLSAEISAIRENAFARRIPTADGETLAYLQTVVTALKPKRALELGTAVGISGAVILQSCENCFLTTVERDENFFAEAKSNFSSLGLDGRTECILGDAGEVILKLEGQFDFIFLDCAKVQYIKYLPALKKLLKKGGVLLADDVLLYGWITGECEIPKKRRMLATHVREYVDGVLNDNELSTVIINAGDGLALSVKIQG